MTVLQWWDLGLTMTSWDCAETLVMLTMPIRIMLMVLVTLYRAKALPPAFSLAT